MWGELKVPFNLPFWDESELALIDDFLQNPGWQTEKILDDCQALLKKVTKTKHVLLLDRASHAIQVALQALDLKKDDEVIVPNFICSDVIEAVIRSKATPVLVDIQGHDLNISLSSVLEHITARTRCVIVAHLGGVLVDIPALKEAIANPKILILEDAAQAFGLSEIHGDMAVLSFGVGKNLYASAGGALLSCRKDWSQFWTDFPLDEWPINFIQDRLHRYKRSCFDRSKTWAWEYGKRILPRRANREEHFKPRKMTAIDAALLMEQIEKWPRNQARRIKINQQWCAALGQSGSPCRPVLPAGRPLTKFPVRFEGPSGARIDRSQLKSIRVTLMRKSVETEWSYTPLSLRPAYQKYGRHPLPQSLEIWSQIFNLPLSPALSDEQITHVVESLKDVSDGIL